MSTQNKIKVDLIESIPIHFPQEFIEFCNNNNLKPPKISTGNGKALSSMLNNPNCYFERDTCNQFVKKFDIETNDSIQLFNKHEQWGIRCLKERGKYGILFPYQTTNKFKMRKDFKYDGTEHSKNAEIENIKSHILENYVNVPNCEWQLGHKNPDTEDNSKENLVLQPPIQGKYRDDYIFLDTITKIPTPKKLEKMIEKGVSPYTLSQLKQLKTILNRLI